MKFVPGVSYKIHTMDIHSIFILFFLYVGIKDLLTPTPIINDHNIYFRETFNNKTWIGHYFDIRTREYFVNRTIPVWVGLVRYKHSNGEIERIDYNHHFNSQGGVDIMLDKIKQEVKANNVSSIWTECFMILGCADRMISFWDALKGFKYYRKVHFSVDGPGYRYDF